MRKLAVPVLCVLVGCAAGVAMPSITAQTYEAAAPTSQRWENYCAMEERQEFGSLHSVENRSAYNALLRRMGDSGWQLVATATPYEAPCFIRPAQ